MHTTLTCNIAPEERILSLDNLMFYRGGQYRFGGELAIQTKPPISELTSTFEGSMTSSIIGCG